MRTLSTWFRRIATVGPRTGGTGEAEGWNLTLIGSWVAATLFLVIILAITAPITALVGGSSLVGLVHGMLATLGVVFGSVSGYLGWRLFIGEIKAYGDLKLLSILSTIIAGLTILFGNWIYIAYRGAGGPRSYFLANNPDIHNVFFEFKEFIALFPLPLSVALTYIVWRYSDSLRTDKSLRTAAGVIVAVAWATLMIAFVLGAAITKLRSV